MAGSALAGIGSASGRSQVGAVGLRRYFSLGSTAGLACVTTVYFAPSDVD
jgi:hypothetical protein